MLQHAFMITQTTASPTWPPRGYLHHAWRKWLPAVMIVLLIANAANAAENQSSWPDEALFPGETPQMLETARSALDFFGYNVKHDPYLDAAYDHRKLRSEIKQAQLRLLRDPTGRVTDDFLEELQDARESDGFPCPTATRRPSTITAQQFSENGYASYTFVLRGARPSLYLVQMLARYSACAPNRVLVTTTTNAAKPSQRAVWNMFFTSAAGKPPPYDQHAARQLKDLSEKLSLHQDMRRPVVPNVGVTVFTIPNQFFSTSKAVPEIQEGKIVTVNEAVPPTNRDLARLCRTLLGQTKCEAPQSIERIDSDDGEYVLEYGVVQDHYNIEATILLPSSLAPALSEDMYRYVIELNRELAEPENEPFYAISSLQSGRQNQNTGDGVNLFPKCAENGAPFIGERLVNCIRTLAETAQTTMRSKVGWPVATSGDGRDQSDWKLSLIDDVTFGLARNNVQAMLLGDGETRTEIRAMDINRHPYFPKARSSGFLQLFDDDIRYLQASGDKLVDPFHGVFALGLLTGGYRSWEGIASNAYDPVLKQPVTALNELHAKYNRHFRAITETSFIPPVVKLPEISVFIGDADPCLPDSVGLAQSAWNAKFDELNGALKKLNKTVTPKYLQIIAAPYGCKGVAPGISPQSVESGSGPLKIACDYSVVTDRTHTARPIACLAGEPNNHSIIVAAANKDFSGIFPKHYRPLAAANNSTLISERFLVAPGCDLLSADGRDAEAGVRFRPYSEKGGCGSSFAAPLVGALASRIVEILASQSINPDGVDIKTQLITTSSPLQSADTYGLVNFTRAIKSSPAQNTVWFDGFPSSFASFDRRDVMNDDSLPAELKNALEGRSQCTCYFKADEHQRSHVYDICFERRAEEQLFVCRGGRLKIKETGNGAISQFATQGRDIVAFRNTSSAASDIYYFARADLTKPLLERFEPTLTLHPSTPQDLWFGWEADDCRHSDTDGDKPACIRLCPQVEERCVTIPPQEFSHILFKGWMREERMDRAKADNPSILQGALQ